MCTTEVCSGYRRKSLSAKEPVALSELWGKKDLKKSAVVCTLGRHTQRRKGRKKARKTEKGCGDKGNHYFGRKKKHKYCIFSAE